MVTKVSAVLIAFLLVLLMLHTHDAGCLPQVCYR